MAKLQTKFLAPGGTARSVAVWRDKEGTLHRAVGAEVHRGIRLLWTACGKRDIPADSAWLQREEDVITCEDCDSVGECGQCGALVDGDGYSIDEIACRVCKAD